MFLPGVLIAGLLAASPGAAAPLSEEAVRRQAEADFHKGMASRDRPARAEEYFARAAKGFEELGRRGADNAGLYANLGQAHLLAGDWPRSILAFRRGLALAPNDTALRTHLERARDRVVYELAGPFARPPVDDWPPWLPRPGSRIRLAAGLAFYCLFWLTLTRWWMTRRGGWLGWSVSGLAACVALVGSLVGEARQRSWEKEHPVVVIAATRVLLHKGNGTGYPCYDAHSRTWREMARDIAPEGTPLHRGVEARLRFARDGWIQIELAGGEIGWVRRADVVIDPPWGSAED